MRGIYGFNACYLFIQFTYNKVSDDSIDCLSGIGVLHRNKVDGGETA